jgi:membrane fusion protein (multidrug efflux system)
MTLFQKKLFIVVSLSVFSIVSVSYWIYSRAFLSTDNAYINANVVQISPRISGQVRHVYVSDNQFVKEGQVLFDIDSLPYEINISEARAQYDRDAAQLYIAQITAKRTLQLVEKNVASVQEGDVAKATLQSATAALELSRARLEKAILDLKYTKVTAPTNGWITNMTLRTGNVITEYQPLFALISNNQFWVDANFKETNLSKIHPGQKVDVRIDMYPNHLYEGIVDSISGGSGTAFSLLPPQNATGNWVKVTQRVPVRINLTRLNSDFPLRIGTSAIVTIHIK